MGVAEGITILLALLDKVTTMGAAISKARAEQRDLTEAEVDSFVAADDTARANLDAAIKAAKARGQ